MGPAASVASATFSRTKRRAPVGAIGFVLALLVSATAFGQSDAAKKRAQALQVEGLGLLQKGDSRAALQKFDEAFRLVPSPKILFNRGKAHRALGEDVAALADFERFLDEAPYAPKESRVEAERAVQALRPKLAYLEIQVEDVGSTVSVDGGEIGAAPLPRPVVLAPGTHEVRVVKSGMNDDVRSVSPIAGQKLRMVRQADGGRRERPGARRACRDDGHRHAATVARARGAGGSSGRNADHGRGGDGRRQQPAPRGSERPWQITAAWVSAGAGVLFLGAGITAQVLTSAKYDEFNDVHTAPAPAPEGKCNRTVCRPAGADPARGSSMPPNSARSSRSPDTWPRA